MKPHAIKAGDEKIEATPGSHRSGYSSETSHTKFQHGGR